MEPFKKIGHIRLAKLNNAEYAEFSKNTFLNVMQASYPKLGIPKELFNGYSANIQLLSDIVSQSHISNETARIAEANAACDHIIIFLLGLIDGGHYSPIAADREAYVTLANVVKPYRGMQRLPQRQQIAQTRGLLKDLEKEANFALVVKLGLEPTFRALEKANDDFEVLLGTRADEQIAAELPTGVAVRADLDMQYDQLMTLAQSTHVLTPSEETATFIGRQNKLIHDTNAAFNQRMGLYEYWKKKKEEETGAGDGGETGGEDPAEVLYEAEALSDAEVAILDTVGKH